MKALAIGSLEFIRFFRLLGFIGKEADEDNLVSVLEEAVKESYGLIVVDSSLIIENEETVRRISAEATVPVIIISPPFKVRETPEVIKEEVMKSLRLS